MPKLPRTFPAALLLCLLVVLCAPGCKPEPPPPPSCASFETCDSLFLSRFFFKEGSWWVYRRTSDGALDTVRVIQYFANQIEDGHGITDDCVWAYSVRYSHTDSSFWGASWFSVSPFYAPTESFAYSRRGGAWGVVEDGQRSVGINEPICTWPDTNLNYIGASTRYRGLEPVEVPAGSWQEAVLIETVILGGDTINRPAVKQYYIVPGVGFVKRVYTNFTTWELVEYHVQF